MRSQATARPSGSPSRWTLPAVTGPTPTRARAKVDLPQPVAPRRAATPPRGAVRATPRRDRVPPRPPPTPRAPTGDKGADEGGLARPVRAEQADDLALGDGQIDAAQDRVAAEHHPDLAGHDR